MKRARKQPKTSVSRHKFMKPKKPKIPESYPTITAAARAIGKDRRTLQRWKADGCPAFLPDGAVDAATLHEWNRVADEVGTQSLSLTECRKELIRVQTLRQQLLYERDKKEVIPRSEVADQGALVGQIIIGSLAQFSHGLPAKLSGRDELAIGETVAAEIDDLIRRVRRAIQEGTGAAVPVDESKAAPPLAHGVKERLRAAIEKGIEGTAAQLKGELELNNEKFVNMRWLYEQKCRHEFADALGVLQSL